MRSPYLLVSIVVLMAGTACTDTTFAAQSDSMPDPTVRADSLDWGPAPLVFPAGAELAVVQGDPSAEGAIFTIRLRMPDGYVIPAHWHPTDENVTVMSGTFLVGVGDSYSSAALFPPMHPGDFITAPANVNHFARASGTTVVQVHATGPFQLTYVNPANNASQ